MVLVIETETAGGQGLKKKEKSKTSNSRMFRQKFQDPRIVTISQGNWGRGVSAGG